MNICLPSRPLLSMLARALPFLSMHPLAVAQVQFHEPARPHLPLMSTANVVTRAFAAGDVDGDGDVDLVLGNVMSAGRSWVSAPNWLHLNDGAGNFTDVSATHLPVNSEWTTALALVDIDGDGDLDLVLGNDGHNQLYRNDGAGVFTDVTTAQLPAPPFGDRTLAVACGDVDGDGDLDLIVGNSTVSYNPGMEQNRLYLNDGIGNYSDVTATQLPVDIDATTAVACTDVDGDGDKDLVLGTGGGQDRLYRNDGTGHFTDVTATNMPVDNGAEALVCCDVDGDGDTDIVLSPGRLYRNDGTGRFTDVTSTNLPTAGSGPVVASDVDLDGDLDLLFANGALAAPGQLLLNDGSGAFADATTTRMPTSFSYAWALACCDFDNDGDPDILRSTTIGGPPITGERRLCLNLQHQLDAPVDLQIGHTYTLDAYLRYGPPSPITFALPYVSFAPASIPLPPFGTVGIDPAQAFALPAIVIPQPAGVGSLAIPVPNAPGLIGTSVYSQALLVPYPHQAKLSNGVHDVVR